MDGLETPSSLAVIAVAAVLAPVLSDLIRRPRVPGVLFEILLGIVVGQQVLGWAEVTPFIEGLSQLGLAFLFFLAGFEIDFARVRGTPATLAVTGWLVSVALGLAVGVALVAEGFAISGLLIGLALTTTAVGTLLPILRDREILPTRFGILAVAAGAAGEFGPILAITLLLTGDSPWHEALLLVAFVAVALGAAVLALRPQPPGVVAALHRHVSTSSQLPVRIAVLLLVVLVWLAADLGLDTLLGAFTAGVVIRLAFSPEQREAVEPRLSAIGFGVFIPVFFIVSGMNFDLDALEDPSVAARVPLFLAFFLAVRGLPALFVYRHTLTRGARASLTFLQATALPLVVVITEIGTSTGRMKPENATALVGAAMCSVLVFPLVAFALADRCRDAPEFARSEDSTALEAELAEELEGLEEFEED